MTYPQDVGEFLDRATGSRALRRGIGVPPGPEGRHFLGPSMGTEILGERGAPYQDIGEQRSTMEDQIRLLIEMQRNPEFGGPAGYGLPPAPQLRPQRAPDEHWDEELVLIKSDDDRVPLGPRFRPEGPYGDGAGRPTPKSALDAMELRRLPRRVGNEILLPELGGEAMPR